MAINYDSEELTTKLGLSTSTDGQSLVNPSSGNWENWNEASGKDVQGFIKKQLANSITSLKFNGGDSNLIAENSFGDEIGRVKVEVMKPIYKRTLSIQGFRINQDECTSSSQYPYKGDTKYYLGIALNVVVQTSSSSDFIGDFTLQVGIKNTKVTIPIKVKSVQEGEVFWADVTSLVTDQNLTPSNLANLQFIVSGDTKISADDTENTQVSAESNTYHLIKLSIKVNTDSLILANNTVQFKVEGTSSSSEYVLQYAAETLETLNSVSRCNLKSDTPTIVNDNVSITLSVPGSYEILARAICKTNQDIKSEWIQVNALATSGYSNVPLITVGDIATDIENCDSAQLFKVLIYPSNGGNAEVISYLADDVEDLQDSKFKTGVYSSLQQNDANIEEPFYAYNEFSMLPEGGTSKFLGLSVISQGVEQQIKSLRYNAITNQVLVSNYFEISIMQHPLNKNEEFICTENQNSDLNFNQASVQDNNVFISDNIDSDLGTIDGYNIQQHQTSFKVTAQYSDSGRGLFNTPIDLSNLLKATSGFSLEFTYKTSNINGDDPVFSVGNILFGPGYCRVNAGEDDKKVDGGIWTNSKASYSKTDTTHVLVTYTKNYSPSTYSQIYNQLFSSDFSKKTNYNVLKIYVNGTINREISLTPAQLSTNSDTVNPEFNFQIKPINSDVDFYSIRTYQKPLSLEEIQKNRISSFYDKADKESYYNKNNILNEDGTISFYKAYQKYNVAVIVLPEDEQPLWFGNSKTTGSGGSEYIQGNRTILIHHVKDSEQDYSGRFTDFEYKAQGSSAKKYMIAHNIQASKGKWQKLKDIQEQGESAPKSKTVPLADGTFPKKLVGKVNTASSMQSHKLGATRLFNDCWFDGLKNAKDYYTPGSNGTRAAVYEEPFLYFYVNVSDPSTILTCDDLYTTYTQNGQLVVEDSNVKFFGFLTWGSGKADKPVFGYGDDTPEYILMEGADNGSPGANFKQPWAAFQCWDGDSYKQQNSSVTKTDNFTGLRIKGETLKFENDTDPWDFDYGCDVVDEVNDLYELTEGAKVSMKEFVKFYNGCYEFDYTSLKPWSENEFSVTPSSKQNIKYKYYFTRVTTVKDPSSISQIVGEFPLGTVMRYDIKNAKWVNAGLHYTNNTWEVYSLKNFYNNIQNSATSLGIDASPILYNYNGITINTADDIDSYVIPVYKQMFQLVMEHFVDIENLAYHQAFCRIVSGTDNRAKNTYLQIFGTRYADREVLKGEDFTRVYKIIECDSLPENASKEGYLKETDGVNDGFIYFEKGQLALTTPITIGGKDKIIEDALVENYKVKTSNSDYKIKFYQDDVDTIFETDNNGQQLKPYYLLEPAFDQQNEAYWGDSHSSLFYPFDIAYADKINDYTQKILDYLVGSNTSLENPNSRFYQYFFNVQKYFPEIAYNHTAEIYYEVPQLFYNQRLLDSSISSLSGFTNNNVSTPLSLSHGSCYESEVQFVTDRFKFLGGLMNTLTALRGETNISSAGSGGSSNKKTFGGKAKFIDYTGPGYSILPSTGVKQTYNFLKNNKDSIIYNNYDPILENISDQLPSILQKIAYPISKLGEDNSYDFSTIEVDALLGLLLNDTDKYKEIEINKGLEIATTLIPFPNASVVTLSSDSAVVVGSDIVFSKVYPVVEKLTINNVTFSSPNVTLDFRGCSRLKEIILNDCGQNITTVIIPDNKQLTKVVLPSSVTTLSLGNVPNLTSLELNGCKLKNLTVDVNNTSILNSILINNISSISSVLNLNNQKKVNFILPLDSLNQVLSFNHVTYTGNIYIGEDSRCISNADLRQVITWKQKQLLAKLWGDIDNSSSVVRVYYKAKKTTKVTIANSITLQNDGIPNYGIDINGNDLKINKNDLVFQFTKINNTSSQQNLIDVESSTGYITINSAADQTEINVQVKVQLDTGNYFTASNSVGQQYTTIIIGFYYPQLGDFAYSDGTFSKYYDPSNKPIGFVYYAKDADSNVASNSVEVRIMSLKASSTNQPLGISSQPGSNATNASNYSERTKMLSFLKAIGLDNNDLVITPKGTCDEANHTMNDNSVYYSDNLTQPSDLSTGKSITATYISQAGKNISTLSGYNDSNFEYSLITKNNYIQIIEALNKYQHNTIAPEQGLFGKLVYPAFEYAYYYEPSSTTQYKTIYEKNNNHWYIPSMEEVNWILQNLINSQITGTTGEENKKWKTQDWNGNNGFFLQMYQEYSRTSSGKLGTIVDFIGPDYKVTSESISTSPYFYGEYNDSPKWRTTTNYWEDTYFKDSTSWKVIPCIQIYLSKNGNN